MHSALCTRLASFPTLAYLQKLHISTPLEQKTKTHKLSETSGQVPSHVEPNGGEKVNDARLLAQKPASRVSNKPSGNNRQERKDAVSSRKDGNRGAGNTLARQQDRTKRRSSTSGRNQSAYLNNMKASAAIAWQISPLYG